MKVLLITRGFEDYVIELANSLASLATVHLALAQSEEWMATHLHSEVTIFKTKAPRTSSVRNVFSMWRLIRYIYAIKPDIIHIQGGVTWELLVKISCPSVRIVSTLHDINKHLTWSRGTLAYWLQQKLIDCAARCADAVVVHGRKLREEAMFRYKHLSQKTCIVVPHGVITRYGVREGRRESSKEGRVLFFGHMNKYKGIEYLVLSESLVCRVYPDVRIRIVGMASKPEYYENLCKDARNIEIISSFQTDEAVTSHFEWADVVVLPYVEASQSGVLQLAFSFATPAVVTNVGALPEVVDHERNGLIVEPCNENELARAILRSLEDTELRAKLIGGIRMSRDSEFAWRSIARKTMKVYEQVLLN